MLQFMCSSLFHILENSDSYVSLRLVIVTDLAFMIFLSVFKLKLFFEWMGNNHFLSHPLKFISQSYNALYYM
jgi:hypothetical protein